MTISPRIARTFLLLAGAAAAFLVRAAAAVPSVGAPAPDFTLATLDGAPVRLADLTAKGNVVLVVLRGWPGYQCPICDLQVKDFIDAQSAFAAAKAQLLFVYPGPAEGLTAHAREFTTWKGKQWPAAYLYALDPDYAFVNAYGLRWDAPRETAYPSTFIIDRSGTVRFAHVSPTHGDRTKAAAILAELQKIPGA